MLRSLSKGVFVFTPLLIRLCAVGDLILHRDKIEIVLEALPTKYDSIIVVENSRLELFSLDELEFLLLSQKSLIFKMKKEVVDTVMIKRLSWEGWSLQVDNLAPTSPQVLHVSSHSSYSNSSSSFNSCHAS